MDGLTVKITSGNRKAISLAKTSITTPILLNTELSQGAVFALPLDVETNQRSASAEVSESLVICSDAKEHISDNVAPGSMSWHLTGYIAGNKRLEPSNYFQPFVQLYTDILWNWFKNGAVLVYKDGNCHAYPRVVIKDLQTSHQKDCANATPFSMTLKEINVMDLSSTEESETLKRIKTALPGVGSALGAPITLGMTTAETIQETA